MVFVAFSLLFFLAGSFLVADFFFVLVFLPSSELVFFLVVLPFFAFASFFGLSSFLGLVSLLVLVSSSFESFTLLSSFASVVFSVDLDFLGFLRATGLAFDKSGNLILS
ncbi:MAG: hypothetical protein RLP12_03995 [Ekhidna sp.]